MSKYVCFHKKNWTDLYIGKRTSLHDFIKTTVHFLHFHYLILLFIPFMPFIPFIPFIPFLLLFSCLSLAPRVPIHLTCTQLYVYSLPTATFTTRYGPSIPISIYTHFAPLLSPLPFPLPSQIPNTINNYSTGIEGPVKNTNIRNISNEGIFISDVAYRFSVSYRRQCFITNQQL